MKHAFREPSALLLFLFALAFSASAQRAPAIVAPQSPEMKQMQRVEDLWDDSVAKRDQYGLELVMSPQFIDISSSGDVTTRNQQIARLFLKDDGSPQNLQQKVVTVRMYGDISLVNGTYTMQKHESGGLVEERGVYTHVFQRVRTAWQCVNSQRTVVAEESLTKPKARKKNGSAAELPMHVPLLYPGRDPATAVPQSPPAAKP